MIVNVVLWVIAALLALVFLGAGLTKLTRPKAELRTRMAWVEDFSPGTVKLIGALEVLGALGLILPAVTGIAPVLVPLAAVGLVLVMAGATITHLRRRERAIVPATLLLLVLAAVVAWGRFGTYALPVA